MNDNTVVKIADNKQPAKVVNIKDYKQKKFIDFIIKNTKSF